MLVDQLVVHKIKSFGLLDTHLMLLWLKLRWDLFFLVLIEVKAEFVIVLAVKQMLMFWQVLYKITNSIDAMVFLQIDVIQQ